MTDFTNFTLQGIYYTAVFFRDDDSFCFKAELTPKSGEDADSVLVSDTLTLKAMGAELIEMAAKADSMIKFSREGVAYEGVI